MCFARWDKDMLRLRSTAKHSAQAQNPLVAAIYAMGARMRQECASGAGERRRVVKEMAADATSSSAKRPPARP